MESTKQITHTFYDALSPDGFSINREGLYRTKEDAQAALEVWVHRYDKQGYYSTANRDRIPLGSILLNCNVVPVERTPMFENDMCKSVGLMATCNACERIIYEDEQWKDQYSTNGGYCSDCDAITEEAQTNL